MKQLSTKTLESLLVATVKAIKSNDQKAAIRHLDRVLRRHDRKGELRASLLGLKPMEFKAIQKQRPFDDIIKLYGFKKRQDFSLALIGKIRSELLYRGWSRQRIDDCTGRGMALAM